MTTIADLTRDWAERRRYPCTYVDVTGSTNDDAKRSSAEEQPPARLFVTAHQTAGRGRGANRWLDAGDGQVLLSTWSFAVPTSPQAITAPRVGLALYAAAAAAWPDLSFGLKAPNDLYLAGQKIAGLLVETVSNGARYRLIVGLGLNVGAHPREVTTATSVRDGLGRAAGEAEWFTFLDEWTGGLARLLPEITRPKLTPTACERLRDALNANVAKTYVVTEITPHGDLIHDGGRVPWSSL